MLRVIFQAFSYVCLAAALVTGVLDVTRSIADSGLVLTPLYTDWARYSAGTLDVTRTLTMQYVHAYAWDPAFVTLLKAPSWAVFTVLGVLFALAARRRRRRWQEDFEI